MKLVRAMMVGCGLALSAIALMPSGASANTLLERTCRLEANDDTLEDGSHYDKHLFAGTAGQTVTVLMESDDFDPYLILLDPNGNRVGENDDISETNLNASIALTLDSNGIYSVISNSYDESSYGGYNLLVSSPSSTPQPVSDMPADCGNSRPRTLDELQRSTL